MTTSTFLAELDTVVPASAGMAGDPIGLQVGNGDREITNIAVAYEIDERTVAEAARLSADIIVAYHPLIYSPLKRLIGAGRVDRSVQELIRRGVDLYVLHTALDAHPNGSTARLAESLGLREISTLDRHDESGENAFGIGRIGTLPEPMSIVRFVERVGQVCRSRSVRYSLETSGSGDRAVQRIAMVAGSGMSLYPLAVEAGADLFLTGDAKYHDFHAANDAIPIVDAGHAETERFVVESIVTLVEATLLRLGGGVALHTIAPSAGPIGYAA